MTPNNTSQPANAVSRDASSLVTPKMMTAQSGAPIQSTTQPTMGQPPSTGALPAGYTEAGGGLVHDASGNLSFAPSAPVQVASPTATLLGLSPQSDGTYANQQGQMAGYQTQPSGQPPQQQATAQMPAQTPQSQQGTIQAPGNTDTGPLMMSGQPSSGAPNPASQVPGLQDFISQMQSGSLPGGIQSSLGSVPLDQQMQQAQQAAYKQATGYLDPQFANQQSDLQNQLINQGIPQGSDAWNRAMDDFGRQKTFAYSQAENNAVQQGNAAQAQLFGQNLSSGQFGNSAQQQAAAQILQQLGLGTQLGIAGLGAQTSANQLAEQQSQNNFNNSMGMRQEDINELLLQQQNPLQMYNALLGNSNVTNPQFAQTPGANVGSTDIASIIQQYMGQQNSVYNAQVGAQNSQTAGESAIAAAAIAAMFSDRRLKTNIRMIGMHEVGVPLYTFDYVWGEPGIGVMADELEQVLPHAVFDVGGMKAVNYAEFSKVA